MTLTSMSRQSHVNLTSRLRDDVHVNLTSRSRDDAHVNLTSRSCDDVQVNLMPRPRSRQSHVNFTSRSRHAFTSRCRAADDAAAPARRVRVCALSERRNVHPDGRLLHVHLPAWRLRPQLPVRCVKEGFTRRGFHVGAVSVKNVDVDSRPLTSMSNLT